MTAQMDAERQKLGEEIKKLEADKKAAEAAALKALGAEKEKFEAEV